MIYFYLFSGSRYISWLPNFSVEVTHINNVLQGDQLLEDNQTPNPTSQIRTLARQIQMMFPRYPLSTIVADLQVSRSMEVTIDNILNGQLLIPGGGRMDFDDDDFAVNAPPANTRGLYSDDTNSTNTSANTSEASRETDAGDNVLSQHPDDRFVLRPMEN